MPCLPVPAAYGGIATLQTYQAGQAYSSALSSGASAQATASFFGTASVGGSGSETSSTT